MGQAPTLSATDVPSERLLLRKAHDADREGFIEILTDPEVRAYLGGPQPRSGSYIQPASSAIRMASILLRAPALVMAFVR
ncbi:hypothetical protein [Streptosporangium sp. NBC_01756]|uniref:hypothetical protein n=1 Tax=Streptosporangium sp. NBC_01756 TaxID=2975950 RepID=UPI002DD8A091|nr:hypothetical protein [Streptosporangium sp. NBC_01756]WSC90807.1 GNAT family N-acetyltransferase [Streptosporangium sp. NBC_01756]